MSIVLASAAFWRARVRLFRYIHHAMESRNITGNTTVLIHGRVSTRRRLWFSLMMLLSLRSSPTSLWSASSHGRSGVDRLGSELGPHVWSSRQYSVTVPAMSIETKADAATSSEGPDSTAGGENTNYLTTVSNLIGLAPTDDVDYTSDLFYETKDFSLSLDATDPFLLFNGVDDSYITSKGLTKYELKMADAYDWYVEPTALQFDKDTPSSLAPTTTSSSVRPGWTRALKKST